jgi:hypothetical protein
MKRTIGGVPIRIVKPEQWNAAMTLLHRSPLALRIALLGLLISMNIKAL